LTTSTVPSGDRRGSCSWPRASIARIEALADVAAHREALTEVLGRMTDPERDAVRLRVLEELDYRTIAARLGWTEGTARGRVHRGLTRLARLMEVPR
jgi:RNA polymerase sigma factor (sigma-70 family)